MEPVRVKIYTPKHLQRLDYIASIILSDTLGLKYEVVTTRDNLAGAAVINYSPERIEGSFMIAPHPLLSESGVMEREIVVSEWNGLPVFFHTDRNSDLPFDIFAASFWLVTRYEEYLPFTPDKHGRFSASESLAFRNGFTRKPLVDLWARGFAVLLLKKFPELVIRKSEYRALLTVDIDVPFAYLGRNLPRNMGGFIRDLASGKGNIARRCNVLLRKEKDPCDIFDYIKGAVDSSGSDARFFFSMGNYSSFDKNPNWKNKDYSKLIRDLVSQFPAGVHPSYYAATKPRLLGSEISRLETIAGHQVKASRFHYLRIFFPQSFRNLIKAGISEDYSLCWHDEPGFRAGIARPFMFYDLAAEKLTGLRIIPFQVMDVTLFQYRKLDPEAATEVISGLIREIRSVGGIFISLWHNTSLQDTSEGKRWRSVFESMLQLQQQ